MDDVRIGNTLRVVRIRKRLRQADVARRAGVSRETVSRLERGGFGRVPHDTLRAMATTLGIRVDIRLRWQGGDLDRVMNAADADLHESLARHLARLPGWQWRPEVSFSIYGERGVIDILAWHAATRSLFDHRAQDGAGGPTGAGSDHGPEGSSGQAHRRPARLETGDGQHLGGAR